MLDEYQRIYKLNKSYTNVQLLIDNITYLLRRTNLLKYLMYTVKIIMIIIKQCLIPINTTSHTFLNYRLSYFFPYNICQMRKLAKIQIEEELRKFNLNT